MVSIQWHAGPVILLFPQQGILYGLCHPEFDDSLRGNLNGCTSFGISAHASLTGNLSSIAFRTIVSLAQHLAVFDICPAALAPCSYMVSVHFLEFINLGLIGIVPNSTKRTI